MLNGNFVQALVAVVMVSWVIHWALLQILITLLVAEFGIMGFEKFSSSIHCFGTASDECQFSGP